MRKHTEPSGSLHSGCEALLRAGKSTPGRTSTPRALKTSSTFRVTSPASDLALVMLGAVVLRVASCSRCASRVLLTYEQPRQLSALEAIGVGVVLMLFVLYSVIDSGGGW